MKKQVGAVLMDLNVFGYDGFNCVFDMEKRWNTYISSGVFMEYSIGTSGPSKVPRFSKKTGVLDGRVKIISW